MTEIERLTEAVQRLITEVRTLQEESRPKIMPLKIETDGSDQLLRNIEMLAHDTQRVSIHNIFPQLFHLVLRREERGLPDFQAVSIPDQND